MIVILNNIRSKFNVGSIFRTADACGGCEKLYLCGITPTPLDHRGVPNRGLIKVSLGAETFIPWEYKQKTSPLLKTLKKEGRTIYALELHKKATPYHSLHLSPAQFKKAAFLLGAEVEGLSPALLKQADHILEIPMRGKKESLNVAIAFGIVLFALRPKGKR